MMREIKFRFFTPDRRMIEDHEGWVAGIGINEALECSISYGYKVMQYTALKDKDGKEIWESDVIKFYYWSTYEQRSFPEYVDFRETEMKEGRGVVYWNETELSWYVRPIAGTTVYHGSETAVQLDEIPLVYAGLTIEAISEWLGEYDASEGDLKQYAVRDGIEVIGNIYENPELLNQ